MRDRLIELLKSKSCWYNDCETGCDKCGNVGLCDRDIEIIADYLIENGVIAPPCKVGDKVWFVERRFHYNLKTFKEFVCEGYVKAIKVSMKPMKITIEYPIADDTKGRCKGADWSALSIGKTVFLTREEAEQAMKGGAE